MEGFEIRRRRRSINEKYFIRAGISIPDDLFMGILLQLPIKSLLRFKSISKTWMSLISSPGFIRLASEVPCRIIDTVGLENSISIWIVDHEEKQLQSNLDQSNETCLPVYRRSLKILGFCKGLICFGDVSHLLDYYLIWNVATGEFRRLPSNLAAKRSCTAHGFGFSTKNDDYILVALTYKSNNIVGAQIYSLNNNVWTVVESHALPSCRKALYISSACLFHGILHWLVTSGSLNGQVYILTFDLNNGKFSRMELPCSNRYEKRWNNLEYRLFALDDQSLLLLECSYRGELEICVNVWLMKEYGIKESWTKWQVITVDKFPLMQSDFIIYLESGENEEGVMQGEVFVYDFVQKKKGTRISIHECFTLWMLLFQFKSVDDEVLKVAYGVSDVNHI